MIQLIDQILDTGCLIYHFGDSIDMKEMMQRIPKDCLAMGNVSPSAQFLNGTPSSGRIETMRVLENCKEFPNFIVSSGCDIPPLTEFENIDAFFDTAKSFYYKQHLLDMIV